MVRSTLHISPLVATKLHYAMLQDIACNGNLSTDANFMLSTNMEP